MVDTILFDWSGTLAHSGCRKLFLYHPNLKMKRACLKPGVIQALRQLKHAGYRLGIVTNTSYPCHAMEQALKQIGMLTLFNVIICSSNPGQCAKPCSRIFQDAACQMRRHPRQCLYVGDTYSRDVLGATVAGMTAFHLKPDFDWKYFGSLMQKINNRQYM